MSTRRVLNRMSMKTLGRMCSVVIIVAAIGAAEIWNFRYGPRVLDGHRNATYWFAADGTASLVFDIRGKYRGSVPLRAVQFFGSRNVPRDGMAWYDARGNALEWQAYEDGEPSRWRYEAQLRTPVNKGEWLEYTVWDRNMSPGGFVHEGLTWGVYQEDDGNWVFRNSPGLEGENTITLVFPYGSEVVSVEPEDCATFKKGCHVVQFHNLHEPHVVRWRIPDKPPTEAVEQEAQSS